MGVLVFHVWICCIFLYFCLSFCFDFPVVLRFCVCVWVCILSWGEARRRWCNRWLLDALSGPNHLHHLHHLVSYFHLFLHPPVPTSHVLIYPPLDPTYLRYLFCFIAYFISVINVFLLVISPQILYILPFYTHITSTSSLDTTVHICNFIYPYLSSSSLTSFLPAPLSSIPLTPEVTCNKDVVKRAD